VRLLFSVPVQHGKTEIVKALIVWAMLRMPERRHAYATYESSRAYRVSNSIKALASRAGITTAGSRAFWQNEHGGSLVATGIGGPLTGEPIDGLLVIDDPHKNRREAESAVRRRDVDDWYRSTAETRTHPGASVIGVHSRWHPEDYIGMRLVEGGEWSYLNLPAINDGSDTRRPLGAALWASARPLEWLEKKRVRLGEYDWESLFQGRPRPRGSSVFDGDVHFYDEPPRLGYTIGIGADLAYSAKKTSDWSVLIVLAACVVDGNPRYYVLDLIRLQGPTAAFVNQTRRIAARWPGIIWNWRTGGQESEIATLLRGEPHNLPLFDEHAGADKFINAQPVAGAWNRGEIWLPSDKARRHLDADISWVEPLISEVKGFTGLGDTYDDQVDALGTAYDAAELGGGSSIEIITPAHH
jgi:hypothetical protein